MAAFALARVREVQQRKDQYKSCVAKLPMMIATNGLAAALAFMRDKESEVWGDLYRHVEAWFREIGWLGDQERLLEKVRTVSAVEYRRWTREAMALAEALGTAFLTLW
jgi:CRISPR type III-B/RAMP module-associated protein Cmr5